MKGLRWATLGRPSDPKSCTKNSDASSIFILTVHDNAKSSPSVTHKGTKHKPPRIGPTQLAFETSFLGENKASPRVHTHNNSFGTLSGPFAANIDVPNLQKQGKST